jgi:integrase
MSTKRKRRRPRVPERGIFERPPGSGTWWVRYAEEHGRIHREKVGPKGLALEVYRKRKTEVAERRFFPERIRKRELLLGAAIDDYLTRVKGRARSYVNVARNARYWKAALGAKPLRQITPGDIQRYAARRLAAGLAPASVNRELTFLRAVFYTALGDGEIDAIPFGRGAGKVKLLKENNRRVRCLTDTEEAALREKIPEAEWPKVAVALYTGLRQGNEFRLTWGDVNFETGLIRARQSKSGEDYSVPMNDELRRILRTLPSRMRSAWVFPSETGETPLDAKNFIHRVFTPALTAAKIADFHWHDLRHTFASRLVMGGVDLTTVQELLGHKTPAMTSRYAHLSPGHRLAAVQKLNPEKGKTPGTDTSTDTRPTAAKATGGGGGQVVELGGENSEPCWIRTSDPLLKSEPGDEEEEEE